MALISNEEMYIMKIIQAPEDSDILVKGVTKAIKKKNKRRRRRIFKYVIRYFRS